MIRTGSIHRAAAAARPPFAGVSQRALARIGIAAELVPPDWGRWERAYPDGVGASAFSSPQWQRAMLASAPGHELRFLLVDAQSGRLTLPVLVSRAPFARRELLVRPLAYYVMPLETDSLDRADLAAIAGAMCRLGVRAANAWFAPWAIPPAPYPDRHTWYGTLEWHTDPTYVVELEGTAEHHLARSCSKRHLRDLKTNRKRGLTVVMAPSAAQRADYVALYRTTHAMRGWSGQVFDDGLFETAAERMGRGGELALLVHQDRVVGGGVLLYDRHAVHYFQGAVDRSVKGVYPHVSLLAHALEQAELRGVRRLNMGGVAPGNDSLVRFKESWGARPLAVPRLAWSTALRHAFQELSRGRVRSDDHHRTEGMVPCR